MKEPLSMTVTAVALCAEFGLSSVALADIPRVVAAMSRAYNAGAHRGAQMEREACAEICEHHAHALDYGGDEYLRSRDCLMAAAKIRARGQQ